MPLWIPNNCPHTNIPEFLLCRWTSVLSNLRCHSILALFSIPLTRGPFSLWWLTLPFSIHHHSNEPLCNWIRKSLWHLFIKIRTLLFTFPFEINWKKKLLMSHSNLFYICGFPLLHAWGILFKSPVQDTPRCGPFMVHLFIFFRFTFVRLDSLFETKNKVWTKAESH